MSKLKQSTVSLFAFSLALIFVICTVSISIIANQFRSSSVSCDVNRFPRGIARDLGSINSNLLLRSVESNLLPKINRTEWLRLKSLDKHELGLVCLPGSVTKKLDLNDVRWLRSLINLDDSPNRSLEISQNRSLKDSFIELSRGRWPVVSDTSLVSEVLLFRSDLPLGLASYPILVSPVSARQGVDGCFVLLHAGHGLQLEAGLDTALSNALTNGCHALLFEMPRQGFSGTTTVEKNRNPSLVTLPTGTIFDFSPFAGHSAFKELELILGITLLAIFVQPVFDAVSYIKSNYPKSKIFMIGISGGGWTTHLAAAIYPRINWSMAVAGSEPIESAAYDYEQSHYILTRLFGYSRIYALAGSYNRPHIHVFNRRDNCCFKPQAYFRHWQESMSELSRVMELESNYQLFVDESASKHEIGPDSMSIFVEALNS